jgi:hypothetical protein
VARASHAHNSWSLSVILWTIVLAIMSAFQLWRGAYVDGGLFTAITVLLVVDTITGRRIKLLRSPVVAPRWVIALVVGVLGIVLMIAPRHGVVDLVTMVVIGVAVFILGWAPARPRTPLPRQSYRRSAITWATLGVALCVWEALMFGAQHKLSNLTAIFDCNGLESLDTVDNILSIEPLEKRLWYFGWATVVVDGHDFGDILRALSGPTYMDRPLAIVARTVKGKGVSFMENTTKWHYRCPTPEEREAALIELAPRQ